MRKARRGRELASIEEAQAARDSLQANPVTVTANAGESGRLFGAVTTADIADAIGDACQGGQASHSDRSADQGARRLPGQGVAARRTSSARSTSTWSPPPKHACLERRAPARPSPPGFGWPGAVVRAASRRVDGDSPWRFVRSADGGRGSHASACDTRHTRSTRRCATRRRFVPEVYPQRGHINCLVNTRSIDVVEETIHSALHRKRGYCPHAPPACVHRRPLVVHGTRVCGAAPALHYGGVSDPGDRLAAMQRCEEPGDNGKEG